MKVTMLLLVICLCVVSNVLSTPVAESEDAIGLIRERRATSFVCSTCPFVCPHGGACLKGVCKCLPKLGPPRPGDKFPTPVVRP